MTLLSILMPTIPERADRFTKLFNEVHRQLQYIQTFHPTLGRCEILINSLPRFLDGGPSIGLKRQSLINKAQGKYLCFLDDDEQIAPHYLESLMRLCKQGPDIVTFRALAFMSTYWGLVDMRLAYKVNDQLTPDYTARRAPWHICPVRTDFARLHKFKDLNNAEDFDWMERVIGQCTTEVHTDKILFMYNHGEHSEADKIPLP